MASRYKIGLALGSGSARGWSHIGIINQLADIGVQPDIVCGSSIGSLVGAAYVSQRLAQLQNWACSLSKIETLKFLNINTSFTGFVNTERLHFFLNQHVVDDEVLIEELEKTYAAVATDLYTGREVWLRRGKLIEAVWSSISLPGLFPAIKKDDTWLVDGGLVNPVPVSACRALGADIVIAVNLNGDIVGKHFEKHKPGSAEKSKSSNKLTELVREYTAGLFTADDEEQPPGILDAIAGSMNITQDRITRSRMAGDPPDIVLTPKLAHIGLLEFFRAQEAITEGQKCVDKQRQEILALVGIEK